jgi:hypothetical protein
MDPLSLKALLTEADEFRVQAHIEAEEAYQRKLSDAYDAWHREDLEKDNPVSEKSKEA